MLAALGLLVLALSPAQAWERNPPPIAEGQPHYDLEVMYTQGKAQEILVETRRRLAADPTDVDLYWHQARAIFEVAEVYDKDDKSIDKEDIYEEMIAVADAGLALDPGNPHLLFARGIGRGRLGTTRGVLSSLFMAQDIEADWKATLDSGYAYRSLNDNEWLPCDAHLTLGIFYRLVPDWWIVQVIAGTRGDLTKSIVHLQAADACSPQRIQIIKELGVSRVCKGQKDKDKTLIAAGLEDWERGLKVRVSTAPGRIDQRHLGMLIADPSLACEYSRDGQADLDRAKLEKAGK